MKLWRALERLGRAAFIVAASLGGSWVAAMTIMPPAPIPLQFEARTDRLTRDGLVALNELAVRAAQCPANELALHLSPAKRAQTALAKRRVATVQKRMEQLGLKLVVEMKPLRDGQARPRHRDTLLADVGAADDVWCDLRAGSQAFAWAEAMGQYVEGAEPRMPAFWQRLSKQGRSGLAMPLAVAAVCAGPGCTRHPELYHWLAEQSLREASMQTRRWWLLQLWARAEGAEVERFRQRWGLAPLTLQERAGHAHELAAGGLPWAVIEQRLREPEVMSYFGEQPMILGGPGPHWLLGVATQQGQLDAFDRLIEAAGPAKGCFVMAAFWEAGGDQEQFEAWRPHFASWARGATVPYQPKNSPVSCNPVAAVLREAFCTGNAADVAARYEAIWDILLEAGVTLESPAVRLFTEPAAEGARQPCRLEPIPGYASRLRQVERP
ncbi:hypothetical protein [Pelomonas sp. Root1237]|uniref:hypothetical protein n=1 Tax=Pelomonas sp. Root1237 TaxID=1736434 RepID=UPI000701FA27|nr:hypothetical protein [Pelomonas sp. Root1237]KQV86509.1 hypothetical protein ASC91_22000 [Pelomonas sp. Root1237]